MDGQIQCEPDVLQDHMLDAGALGHDALRTADRRDSCARGSPKVRVIRYVRGAVTMLDQRDCMADCPEVETFGTHENSTEQI